MRRIIFIILFLLIMLAMVNSAEEVSVSTREVKKLLSKVSPSIVKVVSENKRKYIATGIVIEKDKVLTSTILTRHFDTIYVETSSGKRIPATLIANDYNSAVSLLGLETSLKPVKKADRADRAEVGDWIALVGAFYNTFPSIYQGIVSSITDQDIILNAPVAPGASGGAVINKDGKLIAVIRGRFGISFERDFAIRDSKGEIFLFGRKAKDSRLCYALPIKRIEGIVQQLKKFGEVKRGWIGIYLNTGPDGKRATITGVVDNSPAHKAGLMKGDMIITLNQQRINRATDVARITRSLFPGKVVKVEVNRGEVLKKIIVTVGVRKPRTNISSADFFIERPDVINMPGATNNYPRAENFVYYPGGVQKLGIDVLEITPELAAKLDVREDFGLMISKVKKMSPGDKSGLKVGDVIVKANNRKMRVSQQLAGVLKQTNERQQVIIDLYRDGKLKSVKVVPGKIKSSFFKVQDYFRNRIRNFSYNLEWANESDSTLKDIEKLLLEADSKPEQAESLLAKIARSLENIKKRAELKFKNKIKTINYNRMKFDKELRELKTKQETLKKKMFLLESSKKKEQQAENRL